MLFVLFCLIKIKEIDRERGVYIFVLFGLEVLFIVLERLFVFKFL